MENYIYTNIYETVALYNSYHYKIECFYNAFFTIKNKVKTITKIKKKSSEKLREFHKNLWN